MWAVLTEHHSSFVGDVQEAYPGVGWTQDALVVDEAVNILSTDDMVTLACIIVQDKANGTGFEVHTYIQD